MRTAGSPLPEEKERRMLQPWQNVQSELKRGLPPAFHLLHDLFPTTAKKQEGFQAYRTRESKFGGRLQKLSTNLPIHSCYAGNETMGRQGPHGCQIFSTRWVSILSRPDKVSTYAVSHIGLATVTYLYEGKILHGNSVRSVQTIQPGDANWMAAGLDQTVSSTMPGQCSESKLQEPFQATGNRKKNCKGRGHGF
ncbi:MAG: pirin [Nitrosospira multiformis]|jgi:hypothetical protein|nr:pirin [Nitrosospira multiformis]